MTVKGFLLSLLADPKIINYGLIGAYGLNAVRWGFYGSWADVLYWSSALGITLAVTFGYSR